MCARRLRISLDAVGIVGIGPCTPAEEQYDSLSSLDGFVPYSRIRRDFASAIRTVAEGRLWFSREILEYFASQRLGVSRSVGRNESTLTPHEVTVLGLLERGLSNKEISGELGITERTAKFHEANIYGKLGVHDRLMAVKVWSSMRLAEKAARAM